MKIRNVSWLSALFLLLFLLAAPSALAEQGKQCDNGAAIASCSKCGDGYCAKQCGETAQSCPKDCGTVESIKLTCGKCGDGHCTPQCGETSASCPKDCGIESDWSVAKAMR